MSVWKKNRSLRFRLAMWNAGAVLCASSLIILAIHQATRWAMLHSLDQLLIEDIAEIELGLKVFPIDHPALRDDLNRKALGHRRHEWFVRFVNDHEQTIWASQMAPARLLSPLTEQQLKIEMVATHRFVTKYIAEGNPVRWIRVGASMQPLSQELQWIDRIAVLISLATTVISPITGWYLSGRALQPLRLMVQTASNLRPDRMTERLPIRDADDELDQLAATINLLLDRISTDVGIKHDFLANAAHELRTPLAAIRATADVALVSQRSNEEYRELAIQIMEQTTSLSEIVNQLLLLSESSLPSRIDSQKPFQLDQLVIKAVDMFKAVAEANDVSLRVDHIEKVTISGNRDQWVQVLNNLLDNSIKYTPAGGRVAVDLRSIADVEDRMGMQITVTDTGIGIPPEEVSRVFDRFFRADRSRTRMDEVMGSGLGLSICKAVVESHGGTITCNSQPGQGTMFIIRGPSVRVDCEDHKTDDGKREHR